MKATRILPALAFALAGVLGVHSPARADSGPAEGCAKGSEKLSFGDRFVDTYKDYLKWDGDPADTPQSWRKGLQPPMESSPPMPFGYVPTVIGVPGVLVAVVIGVTVPGSLLATYAVWPLGVMSTA